MGRVVRVVVLSFPRSLTGIAVGFTASLFLWGSCWAEGVMEVAEPQESWNLAPYVDYLEEQDGAWTFEEVSGAPLAGEFRSLDAPSVNFGLAPATRWFRFAVRNGGSEPKRFYLELDNPRLALAEFYGANLAASESRQVTGSSIPFGERSVRHRNAVFAITLESGQAATVYLRVVGEVAFRFNVTLWEREAFGVSDVARTTIEGAFFGTLFIMAVFNVFLLVIFRDRSFLYLASLTFFVLAHVLTLRGYAYQFLWPNSPGLSPGIFLFFLGFAIYSGLMLTRHFLNTKSHAPILDKVILGAAALNLSVSVITFLDHGLASIFAHTVSTATSLLPVLAAIVCMRKQRRPAQVFLAAFLTMYVGIILHTLLSVGLVPTNFVTENGFQFAFPLTLVLFSLAIWDRLKTLEEDHRSQLERRVEERTRDLAAAVAEVRTLHGLIPICSHCKKVRDDKGYWSQIETYISSRSDADFSHGICPECLELHYPEIMPKGNRP